MNRPIGGGPFWKAGVVPDQPAGADGAVVLRHDDGRLAILTIGCKMWSNKMTVVDKVMHDLKTDLMNQYVPFKGVEDQIKSNVMKGLLYPQLRIQAQNLLNRNPTVKKETIEARQAVLQGARVFSHQVVLLVELDNNSDQLSTVENRSKTKTVIRLSKDDQESFIGRNLLKEWKRMKRKENS
jgi:hypothetical protein